MDVMALDHDLLERLYLEFHPRVLGVCRRMLQSHDEAQDAANDVFLRLPDALKSYDPAQPFSRWIAGRRELLHRLITQAPRRQSSSGTG
jgi:RNA polymerase sigma factor (sigma-70 family)